MEVPGNMGIANLENYNSSTEVPGHDYRFPDHDTNDRSDYENAIASGTLKVPSYLFTSFRS